MLDLNKYKLPIKPIENKFYKWDKIYSELDHRNGDYYDEIDYENFDISWSEIKNGAHNVINIKSSITEKDYSYESRLSHLKDGDTILDCGIGNGAFCDYIFKNFKNIKYYGITNSETQYKYVTKKFKNFKSAHFILDSFDNIQNHFEGSFFDKIYFLESHGYSLNRVKLLKQVFNSLNTNGLLFIKSPTANYNLNSFIAGITCNAWCYNFSTKEAELYDLYQCGFSNIEYKTINFLMLYLTYYNNLAPFKFGYRIKNLYNTYVNSYYSVGLLSYILGCIHLLLNFHNTKGLVIVAKK